ncbi:MAG: 3'-5' exonuclease domain-containing protein 2 [Desulfovibrionaceae bacterium]|nr:3'-5' exonuclease domain-containing protein 2 [Desulfovibrionaceae bacterium]
MPDTDIEFRRPASADPPFSMQARLSREAINALPLFHYEGKVTLVRTPEELEAAVNRLSRETVLGFDTETPPAFRKGKSHAPTLVQLAGSQEVVLFHFKWQPLSSGLISLFENPDITKTGVAVHDDMRFLAKITPFEAQSVIDLSAVAQNNKIENLGLRGLAAVFLGLRISKSEQCSNWGNIELSPRQIRYAATDAWASRAVYLAMNDLGFDLSLPSDSPARRKKAARRAPRRKSKRPAASTL